MKSAGSGQQNRFDVPRARFAARRWSVPAMIVAMMVALLGVVQTGSAGAIVKRNAEDRAQAAKRGDTAACATARRKHTVPRARHRTRHPFAPAYTQAGPRLFAQSALIADPSTGEILYEKQPGRVVPIASLTKLMTAMVVLDAGQALDETIAISRDDVDNVKRTRSRLRPGDSLTRHDALLLALMSSENRAATALGRHYPGGTTAFVQAMNDKAHALGLNDTRYVDASGLSEENVSSAHDLAKVATAAANYSAIRALSTRNEEYVIVNGRELRYRNSNRLVHDESWQIDLSKTGYINEAGRCLVMQAWLRDRLLLFVLLDSRSNAARAGDARRARRWLEAVKLPAKLPIPG